MLQFNQSMQRMFAGIKDIRLTLPDELNSIINEGFFEHDGCFFSKKLMSYCLSASPEYFQDNVGFECFVNSLHIDDYVKGNYLDYSISFSNALFKAWQSFSLDKELNVIILPNDFGVAIKFHLIRPNETWLSEDLEAYEDPVLTTNEIISSNSIA